MFLTNKIHSMFKRLFIPFTISCLLLTVFLCHGQQRDTTSFYQPITLDEVVVRAEGEGFNVKNFIRLIEEDTTFYKAFRSMHLQTFNAINDIDVYNKKGNKIVASEKTETKQIYRSGCRWMNTLFKKTTGNFYKSNGEYRYYTARLFAELFYTKGKVCGEDNIVKGHLEQESLHGDRIEKSITQLKYLMFFPGRPVPGVPFVGNKVAIFEQDIARKYDFKLVAEEKNGVPCYLFEATPQSKYKNDVVINVFRTWLRQSDYAIIARDYALSYKTMVYDFNVQMHVDLSRHNGVLLPTYIRYNGNWHIVTQKRERVKFTAKFSY